MAIQRFRIVEWTSEFKDGSLKIEYELLKQTGSGPGGWERLGTSSTLDRARTALLFYAPSGSCWLS
jgi:hypothetical protein